LEEVIPQYRLRPREATGNMRIIGSGIEGKGDNQFSQPRGICIHAARNEIFVSDCKNHRVQVFHGKTFIFLRQIGKGIQGSGPGYLNLAVGICLHEEYDELFVADTNNHRIAVFNLVSGVHIMHIGSYGAEPGQLNSPYGVCVDKPTDTMYVADSENNRISVFTTSNGKFLRHFGLGQGQGIGELCQPVVVALDTDTGYLYVADYGNNRMVVFDKHNGFVINHLDRFSDELDGRLKHPRGICVDMRSRLLFLTEREHDRILVFKKDTMEFVRIIGSVGQFNKPIEIVVSHDGGSLLVVDGYNHCVQLVSVPELQTEVNKAEHVSRRMHENKIAVDYFHTPRASKLVLSTDIQVDCVRRLDRHNCSTGAAVTWLSFSGLDPIYDVIIEKGVCDGAAIQRILPASETTADYHLGMLSTLSGESRWASVTNSDVSVSSQLWSQLKLFCDMMVDVDNSGQPVILLYPLLSAVKSARAYLSRENTASQDFDVIHFYPGNSSGSGSGALSSNTRRVNLIWCMLRCLGAAHTSCAALPEAIELTEFVGKTLLTYILRGDRIGRGSHHTSNMNILCCLLIRALHLVEKGGPLSPFQRDLVEYTDYTVPIAGIESSMTGVAVSGGASETPAITDRWRDVFSAQSVYCLLGLIASCFVRANDGGLRIIPYSSPCRDLGNMDDFDINTCNKSQGDHIFMMAKSLFGSSFMDGAHFDFSAPGRTEGVYTRNRLPPSLIKLISLMLEFEAVRNQPEIFWNSVDDSQSDGQTYSSAQKSCVAVLETAYEVFSCTLAETPTRAGEHVQLSENMSSAVNYCMRGSRRIWPGPGHEMRLDDLVDAVDKEKTWFESYIVDIRVGGAVKVHFMGWGSKWDDYIYPQDISARIARLNTHTADWRRDLYEGCLLEIKCNEDTVNQKWMWGRVLSLSVEGAWLEVAYQFSQEPTIIKKVELYSECICPLGMHTKDRAKYADQPPRPVKKVEDMLSDRLVRDAMSSSYQSVSQKDVLRSDEDLDDDTIFIDADDASDFENGCQLDRDKPDNGGNNSPSREGSGAKLVSIGCVSSTRSQKRKVSATVNTAQSELEVTSSKPAARISSPTVFENGISTAAVSLPSPQTPSVMSGKSSLANTPMLSFSKNHVNASPEHPELFKKPGSDEDRIQTATMADTLNGLANFSHILFMRYCSAYYVVCGY
jgi:DNA-binding beta-propeller fold protein YncE